MARKVILKVSGFETRWRISSVTRQPAVTSEQPQYHTDASYTTFTLSPI